MIDRFLFIAEDQLLPIILYLFFIGIGVRLGFFLFRLTVAVFFSNPPGHWLRRLGIVLRAIVPYHAAFLQRPVYTIIRYGFHGCLLIVPIWFSGHVYLWEASELEWYWTPLPGPLADALTIALLGIGICLLLRRVLFSEVRKTASFSTYLIIVVTMLPYGTGYVLTHGTLDNIQVFERYMWSIHVLSGETMLLMMIFLTCRTYLDPGKCIGCAACASNCPTGTLESKDRIQERIFFYSHHQCICCGSCVSVCPEKAAALSHEIGIGAFRNVWSKKSLHSIRLCLCLQCGESFAPELQFEHLEQTTRDAGAQIDLLKICNRCKKWLPARRSTSQLYTMEVQHGPNGYLPGSPHIPFERNWYTGADGNK